MDDDMRVNFKAQDRNLKAWQLPETIQHYSFKKKKALAESELRGERTIRLRGRIVIYCRKQYSQWANFRGRDRPSVLSSARRARSSVHRVRPCPDGVSERRVRGNGLGSHNNIRGAARSPTRGEMSL